jgi:peptide/nickel transport system substrate-binding protein
LLSTLSVSARRARLTWWCCCVLGVVAFGLAVVSSTRASTSAGGTLNVAITQEPTTLDTTTAGSNSSFMVLRQIAEPLVQRSANGVVTPVLAASVPQYAGKKFWIIHLRKKIKFSDGSPFTAQDVIDNFTALYNVHSGFAAHFFGKPGATKIDEYTVRIQTQFAVPTFPNELEQLLIEKRSATNSTAPVGTGPYVLDTWNHGQAISLKPNTKYWGAKPKWDAVNFRFIPSGSARVAALQSGQVDFITELAFGDAGSVPNLIETPHANVVYFFAPNTRHGIFQNLKLRQALAYAVDMKSIQRNIFSGYAVINQCQPTAPSWQGYNPKLKAWPYDPAKARQLIKEAGAEGASFSFLGANGDFAGDADFAQAVAGYWKAVGLNPRLTLLPPGPFVAKLIDQSNQSARADISAGFELTRDFDATNLWEVYLAQTGNASSTTDPALDKAMAKAQAINDPKKRTAAFAPVVTGICNKAQIVYGLTPYFLYGSKKGLKFADKFGPEAGSYLLSVDDIVRS